MINLLLIIKYFRSKRTNERKKERKKERKNENERKVGWMDGLSVVLLVSYIYIYIYSAPKFVPPAVLFFVFFLCS